MLGLDFSDEEHMTPTDLRKETGEALTANSDSDMPVNVCSKNLTERQVLSESDSADGLPNKQIQPMPRSCQCQDCVNLQPSTSKYRPPKWDLRSKAGASGTKQGKRAKSRVCFLEDGDSSSEDKTTKKVRLKVNSDTVEPSTFASVTDVFGKNFLNVSRCQYFAGSS